MSDESHLVLSQNLELIDLNPAPLLTGINDGVFISSEATIYSGNISLACPQGNIKPTGYLVYEK